MRRNLGSFCSPFSGSPLVRKRGFPPQSGTVPLWGPRPQPRHTQVTRAGAAIHGHSWDRSFLPATSSHLRRIRGRFLGRRLTSLGLIPTYGEPGWVAVLPLLGRGKAEVGLLFMQRIFKASGYWIGSPGGCLSSSRRLGFQVPLRVGLTLYAHMGHDH